MKTDEVQAESERRTAGARRHLDEQGLNTGPPPALLREHFITPTELFFTRSHAAIPSIDPATWRLRLDGLVTRPLELSLDEI